MKYSGHSNHCIFVRDKEIKTISHKKKIKEYDLLSDSADGMTSSGDNGSVLLSFQQNLKLMSVTHIISDCSESDADSVHSIFSDYEVSCVASEWEDMVNANDSKLNHPFQFQELCMHHRDFFHC
jgi:Ca2+-binding EF-hand superfamily protein